jgi:hypothetical protein
MLPLKCILVGAEDESCRVLSVSAEKIDFDRAGELMDLDPHHLCMFEADVHPWMDMFFIDTIKKGPVISNPIADRVLRRLGLTWQDMRGFYGGPALFVGKEGFLFTDEQVAAVLDYARVPSLSVLRPLPCAYPAVSPLYACLVPHGQDEVDYRMVAPYMVVEEPLHGMSWHFNPRDYARMQHILDLLMLSQTCKHAHTHMHSRHLGKLFNDDACMYHNHLASPMVHAIGGHGIKGWPRAFYAGLGVKEERFASRSFVSLHEEQLPRHHTLKRAILAAFLDRIAVAKWYTPPGVLLNYEAWRDLAPVLDRRPRGPELYGNFETIPFLAPAAPLDKPCPKKDIQVIMWFHVAFQLGCWSMAESLVEWAARSHWILSWLRGMTGSRYHHTLLEKARRVCGTVYSDEVKGKARLALVPRALEEFRRPDADPLDDDVFG